MKRLYDSILREGLSELESESTQRRLWLASGGPEVGSFDEAVAHTYDDSGLSDVLASQASGEILSSDAEALLVELDEALLAVDRDLSVECLIGSAQMEKVRSLAGAALRALVEAAPDA